MCDICLNNSIRNYTHSRSKQHLKHLYKIMKIKKKNYYFNSSLEKDIISQYSKLITKPSYVDSHNYHQQLT